MLVCNVLILGFGLCEVLQAYEQQGACATSILAPAITRVQKFRMENGLCAYLPEC